MINKTLYTLENYKAFLRLLYRKVKILTYITSFILFVFGVTLMFFQFNGYIYIIFALGMLIFVNAFIHFIEKDSINKNVLLLCDTEQTFYFEEARLRIVQRSRMGIVEDEYLYKELYSIYKTKTHYFFFVNRVQAFIVEINGFIDGDEISLDELLNRVSEVNFINKSKQRK
jgi:hypothetical protein